MLSGIDSASDYSRKSKFAGNKVVIEAEVYHQNVNHKHKSYSNLDGTCKKPEEIELNVKMPNQDDYVVVINESKVCMFHNVMQCVVYILFCVCGISVLYLATIHYSGLFYFRHSVA